jgi:hypothetical protein
MKISDLVRYDDSLNDGSDPKNRCPELGIVVEMPQDFFGNYKDQCRVVWFTCDNEGWWSIKNLEIVSGTAGS